jgi:hypothetical protein
MRIPGATFLRNVWAYRDVLARDQDYDHSYLFILLERKLRRMAAHFMTHDIHPNRLAIARQITIAAECCRRVREDRYEDLPYEGHDTKWGKLDLSIQRQSSRHPYVTFSRAGVLTEADHQRERAENERIWTHAVYLKRQDLETLGAMLKRYSQSWWC